MGAAAPADRAARSEAIEQRIGTRHARISDGGLRRLLEGTLPNTLDTTIVAGGTDDRPDTFVVTGDIDAMWLRDSTAQVWPYLASVRTTLDSTGSSGGSSTARATRSCSTRTRTRSIPTPGRANGPLTRPTCGPGCTSGSGSRTRSSRSCACRSAIGALLIRSDRSTSRGAAPWNRCCGPCGPSSASTAPARIDSIARWRPDRRRAEQTGSAPPPTRTEWCTARSVHPMTRPTCR